MSAQRASSPPSGVRRQLNAEAVHRIAQCVKAISPKAVIDTQRFVEWIGALMDPNKAELEALGELALEDLFLAFACSRGDRDALNAFAKAYEGDFWAVAARLQVAKSDAEDARQILWDKLFLDMGPGSMRILDYRGIGRLRHWFRTAAARVLLDFLRQSKRLSSRSTDQGVGALNVAASNDDPELSRLRQHYLQEFRAAFAAAATSLEPDERNCLRCHYLLGMTSDQMAAAFSTHRATAARRVARAREKLVSLTRSQLKERLRATTGEVESVMRLFDGELSVSLSRLFE